jgi:uncharacterized protein (DUF736 family)
MWDMTEQEAEDTVHAELFHQQLIEEQIKMQDPKDNSLVLFPQDKEGNDKRPDFKGKGLLNGEEFEVSVWKNISKAGKPYMSGQLQPPYNGGSAAPRMSEGADTDDNVPF